MNIKFAKVVRIILLVVACISCLVGVIKTEVAKKEAATDISKIKAQITQKECHYTQGDKWTDSYFIDYTYSITNGTEVDWKYIVVTTTVYDKTDKKIGTLTAKFGSEYGSSDFLLKSGKTITDEVEFSARQLDSFFETIYKSSLKDLKFESEVTYGKYVDE